MTGKVKEPPGRLRRTARLLIGPSKLRRPSDRIEGAVLALLSAAFLASAAIAAAAWVGAGIVLGVCYLASRVVLDRMRLAGWESDWALTGPRWTTRR